MARVVIGRSCGFYEEAELIVFEEGLDNLSEDDGEVYSVERVVERRKKGTKRFEYLVLWEGYHREEASWVEERYITAAALRTYINPAMSNRVVLDAVSNLTTGIISSLKKGCILGCSFSVCFRRDVFNVLFNNSGVKIGRKRGKMYDKCDFVDRYFCNSNFVYRNSHGEGVRVDFPIYLYSYVKFVKLSDTQRDFCETLCVKLMKCRC